MGARHRSPSASSGLAREVAIGLGSYGAYLLVRQLVWNEEGRADARTNAELLVDLERRLGIDFEPSVQRFALLRPRAVDVLNVGYAAGNVALSVGWLILLYKRRSPIFRRERRAAVTAFLGALPGFAVFPTAPPRVRDDTVDTLADRGLDIEHPLLVRFYNPVAAMPSHHVAFAVVTGFGLAATRRTLLGRLVWRTYPAAVTGVVIGTGNHFVIDTIAGAALGAAARRLSR